MAIVRLAWQTWLFKIGPEQYPSANSFMWAVIAAKVGLGWLTIVLTDQIQAAAFAAAVTGPLLLLIWVRLLGRVNGYPERVTQLVACLMMGGCVFDLVSIPISMALVPYAELVMQAAKDPLVMEDIPSAVWMLSLLTMTLLVWFLVFMVRTLNAGFEKGLFSSIVYVFVYFVFSINVSGLLALLLGSPEVAASAGA